MEFAGETKDRVEKALERGKKALKQDDTTEINGAKDELMQAFSAAGQQFYQAQAQEQQQAGVETESGEPAGAGARAAGQEDVVEADYEIVDDK